MIIKLDSKFRFKCIRCGKCCSTGPNVALTVYDVVRISKHLGVKPSVALKIYTKVIIADYIPFIALAGDGLGKCVFLGYDKEGKPYCKIYRARPLRCRLYPAIPVSPSKNTIEVTSNCPGVGGGAITSVPLRLVKHYFWEVKMHYKELVKLVLDEGYSPLEALELLVEKTYEEALGNALWCNLEYIDSLGAT